MSRRRGIIGVLDDFRRNPSDYPNGKLAAIGIALALLPNVVMVIGLAITTVGNALPLSSFVRELFGWLMFAGIWVLMGTMLLRVVGIYILIPIAIWRAVRDQQRRSASLRESTPDA